jgi:hypothetical protein
VIDFDKPDVYEHAVRAAAVGVFPVAAGELMIVVDHVVAGQQAAAERAAVVLALDDGPRLGRIAVVLELATHRLASHVGRNQPGGDLNRLIAPAPGTTRLDGGQRVIGAEQ